MARTSKTKSAKAAKGGTRKVKSTKRVARRSKSTRATKPRVRVVGGIPADQVEDAKQSVQAGFDGVWGDTWDSITRSRIHRMLDEMTPAELRDLFAAEPESTPGSIVEFWRSGANNADAGGRRHVLARAKSLLDRVPTRYIEAWLGIFEEYAVVMPHPHIAAKLLTAWQRINQTTNQEGG